MQNVLTVETMLKNVRVFQLIFRFFTRFKLNLPVLIKLYANCIVVIVENKEDVNSKQL